MCIPTFKRPELLKEAVESICRNSFRPIEIAISDNDMSEMGIQWVRTFCLPDDVTIVHRGNLGELVPSANFSNAISLANNERIIWLNDDDLLIPGAIDLMVGAWDASAGNIDAVYGHQLVMTADGEIDMRSTLEFDEQRKRKSSYRMPRSGVWAALSGQVPNVGVMFRKSIAEIVEYPTEREVGQSPIDYHFFIRYAQKSRRPFGLLDEYLSVWRLTENSISAGLTANPVFEDHLSYATLAAYRFTEKFEREAQAEALDRIALKAVLSYLHAGDRRNAAMVFPRHFRRSPWGMRAELAVLVLLVLEFLGIRVLRGHGRRLIAFYRTVYRKRSLWSAPRFGLSKPQGRAQR